MGIIFTFVVDESVKCTKIGGCPALQASTLCLGHTPSHLLHFFRCGGSPSAACVALLASRSMSVWGPGSLVHQPPINTVVNDYDTQRYPGVPQIGLLVRFVP